MKPTEITLEFTAIKQMLADHALTGRARARCEALAPTMDEAECRRRMRDTTAARTILDTYGSPPISPMAELEKILTLCKADAMLLPEQLLAVAQFSTSCRRLAGYLKRAEQTDETIAPYGRSFQELGGLQEEIERCIRNERVDSEATPALRDLRRRIDAAGQQIREKLHSLLQNHKSWFSDSYVSQKNGRFVLPVKKAFRSQVSGSVIDQSGSGGTVFIEPSSVAKLQAALSDLQVEEDNEVRRILYTLTALVSEHLPAINLNMEAMETLDFLFAKAKLSAELGAVQVAIGLERRIEIIQGRHPLLPKDRAVPLDFSLGGAIRGAVITGPNTGGKTVAIKTVGLLSMMAQSGLHIPASPDSTCCMYADFWCDIGDGQSITENLSTFSGHMTNVIAILEHCGPESLVLLDELGSGTDPAEGMGIAIAVLDELLRRGCLFLVTTHYPEVKEFAEQEHGVVSARMAFDRETLSPLYRLEMGQSGESCALYIAQRLGFPAHLLHRAHREAYRSDRTDHDRTAPELELSETNMPTKRTAPASRLRAEVHNDAPPLQEKFQLGDGVTVLPEGELGIIFHPVNAKGEVGVQVKGEKRWVNHKRVKLRISAEELYPEDYDLSIVLDSVEVRKARHQMSKRHRPDLMIVHEEGD